MNTNPTAPASASAHDPHGDSAGRSAATPAVTARIGNNYRWRLALIGLGFTAVGIYCVYDGFVAYPQQKEIFDAWTTVTQEQGPEKWADHAAARGWPTDQPKKRTNFDIYTQFVMAAIFLPVGLIFTWGLIRSFSRFVSMDEQGLRASGGRQCRFDQIVGLDDRRWKNKGISVVQYQLDNGSTGTILLDDWKFDRESTVAIHDRVARQLGASDDAAAAAQPATS